MSDLGKDGLDSDFSILSLTKKQIDKLSEILWEYTDEGPMYSGWASDELIELRNIIDNARVEK